MTTKSASSRKSVGYAEWAITIGLLAVMVGAYVLAHKWPKGTAFFPELLSATAVLLLLAYLASLIWTAISDRRIVGQPAAPKSHSNGEVTLVAEGDEDQGSESELHEVFAASSGRTWLSAIGWIVFFFGGMHLFGLLVILPVFTLAYLRLVAKASWVVCILYVLGTAGLIYVIFEMFLHLPLPQGIFPVIGE